MNRFLPFGTFVLSVSFFAATANFFAAEPNATEPNATEPNATEPNATEPNATEPNAIKSNATEPNDGTDSTQLVRVVVPDPTKSVATVDGWIRENPESPWEKAFAAKPAQVGRNGLARPGAKKEGDGRTPAGEFSFGFLFGRDEKAPDGVSLPYRQASDDDYWVDDPASPDYNRWTSGPEPTASHERLRLPDGPDPKLRYYDLAAVVEYNVDPIVPGAGSAIFFHIWQGADVPTSGCVALSRENVVEILRWLDPKKKPRIRIESPAFRAFNRSFRDGDWPKVEPN